MSLIYKYFFPQKRKIPLEQVSSSGKLIFQTTLSSKLLFVKFHLDVTFSGVGKGGGGVSWDNCLLAGN